MKPIGAWRKTLNWLRREFPLSQPVAVRTVVMDDHGDAMFKDGKFRIRINRRDDWGIRLEFILHEWAHCLTWFGNDTDDHGEEWGLAYARIYREWGRWDYGQ